MWNAKLFTQSLIFRVLLWVFSCLNFEFLTLFKFATIGQEVNQNLFLLLVALYVVNVLVQIVIDALCKLLTQMVLSLGAHLVDGFWSQVRRWHIS